MFLKTLALIKLMRCILIRVDFAVFRPFLIFLFMESLHDVIQNYFDIVIQAVHTFQKHLYHPREAIPSKSLSLASYSSRGCTESMKVQVPQIKSAMQVIRVLNEQMLTPTQTLFMFFTIDSVTYFVFVTP